MTLKQFEQVRISIESEKLRATSSDALTFGIERAAFERQKFKRLIAAAEDCSFATVKAKRATWERQLAKVTATEERLEKLRAEIKAVCPAIISMPT